MSAATYRLPAEEPYGKVKIPDRWKTQTHEEFIETTSPDRAARVLVVAVEGRKVQEAMGEALRYIRRAGTLVINAQSIKKEQTEIKNRPVQTVSWDGTEGGRPIKIRCCPVQTAEGNWLLFVFWGTAAAEKKNQAALEKIIGSIGPAG